VIAIIATLKVVEGKGPEFEAVGKELMAAVRANEPGCTLYTLCRGDEPNTYVFLERYVDEAAVEHHRGTQHFKEIGRKFRGLLEGAPQVRRLAEVG
jgi:quinol monooxygenase YgiN